MAKLALKSLMSDSEPRFCFYLRSTKRLIFSGIICIETSYEQYRAVFCFLPRSTKWLVVNRITCSDICSVKSNLWNYYNMNRSISSKSQGQIASKYRCTFVAQLAHSANMHNIRLTCLTLHHSNFTIHQLVVYLSLMMTMMYINRSQLCQLCHSTECNAGHLTLV